MPHNLVRSRCTYTLWPFMPHNLVRSRCTYTLWPFMPHNLVSAQQNPVLLPKFQLAHKLKNLISSGSRKEPGYIILFVSKSPGKRIPSKFPNGNSRDRDTRLQDIFASLLTFWHRSFTFSSNKSPT